jgi:hypothetical protein
MSEPYAGQPPYNPHAPPPDGNGPPPAGGYPNQPGKLEVLFLCLKFAKGDRIALNCWLQWLINLNIMRCLSKVH